MHIYSNYYPIIFIVNNYRERAITIKMKEFSKKNY